MIWLLLSALSLALCALHLGSVVVVLRRLSPRNQARRPVWPDVAPKITLLRPVCGLDRFDAETLASSFHQEYPDFEVIFCAADGNDPVVAVLEDLIARHPQVRARLLIGDDRITANPKLNNMQKGWQAATGDWVAMADANLLLPVDYLWQLVAARQDGVVLVTSPPLGTRGQGMAGALECAFLNGNQARLQLLADECGQGFAQGKTLFWDRRFLDGQGGLAALGTYLAEDVAATKLVRAAGRRLVLTPRLFCQPVGARHFRAVWLRQLRWSKVRRDGFAGLFWFEPLNGALIPLVLAGLAGGPVAALGMAALWYGAELWLCWRAGWPLGPWALPMMVLRDAMIPVIWAASFGKRGFEWRGTMLGPQQRLHPAE